MSGLTAVHRDIASSPPQSAKPVRIPRRVRQAIDLLLTGECTTQKAAAQRIKMAPETLCRYLKKPATRVFIAQRTRETIDQAQMPAAGTLVKLLDANSEHVRGDIAKHLLAIAGITPPERRGPMVQVNVSPGYIVRLKNAPEDAPGTMLDAMPQGSKPGEPATYSVNDTPVGDDA